MPSHLTSRHVQLAALVDELANGKLTTDRLGLTTYGAAIRSIVANIASDESESQRSASYVRHCSRPGYVLVLDAYGRPISGPILVSKAQRDYPNVYISERPDSSD